MGLPARWIGGESLAWCLIVAGITLLGAALRIAALDQSLYGDELWSYVAATEPSFGGMLDFVRSDAEITPPLYTALAWASAQLGDPAFGARLPALIAGIATIPLIAAIGLRTFGRSAGLLAAALAALSPFLAFYSVEARAYALAAGLVATSTLVLLIALERGGRRWWVGYAALSCAAMYTHYTSAFPLIAQLGWLLWSHPQARRRALAANVAAAIAFLPWIPALLDDFSSPSQANIGALTPFGWNALADFTPAWAGGHPGDDIAAFLGLPLALALAAGVALALAGAFRGRRVPGGEPRPARRDAAVLVALLALAAPAGCALASLLGDDIYIPRNLAVSWPGLAVATAATVVLARPPALRTIAAALVLAPLAAGAALTLGSDWRRPDIGGAADLIDSRLGPGDVVLDTLAPGGGVGLPIERTLGAELSEEHVVIAGTDAEATSRAVAAAAGHRLAIVGPALLVDAILASPELAKLDQARSELPGLIDTDVVILAVPDDA